ncbi:hypothetical protein [Nannocystis sp. SCPEA4]|uniref:hypothetical protein n=1 Tax=Nannocystis sp. SCPEA4 TaxID=2996787 RepID=UPI0022722819|nr:hypothetical protein [Nannocystis sp. SCPEA4]MCY1055425.1 hypothetical protein [Nannocystis sp. SCPEA4]
MLIFIFTPLACFRGQDGRLGAFSVRENAPICRKQTEALVITGSNDMHKPTRYSAATPAQSLSVAAFTPSATFKARNITAPGVGIGSVDAVFPFPTWVWIWVPVLILVGVLVLLC